MKGIPHRYLTERLPGVGGVIKRELEDFQVFEVPLYHPTDQGEHTYFEIEKRDLSTLEALERIARALQIPSRELGYAGLKDRKAITRQTISARLVDPRKVLSLSVPRIEVLWARRHGNKLRIGHLRGNRFRIRVRGIDRHAADRVRQIVETIERCGLPNYYGPQRFGSRGDAFLVGECLLRHDHRGAIDRILGFPSRSERDPRVVRARISYVDGELNEAYEQLPSSYRLERRLLRYLQRAPGNYRRAVRQIPEPMRKIFFSALQSAIFNSILDRRLELTGSQPRTLFDGDLAFLHRNGAVFAVASARQEQSRVDAWEISPSGPLFGKLMPWPEGLELRLEEDALRRLGLRSTIFHQLMPSLRMRGGRRPFSVRVDELKWRVEGDDLVLEFFLPKGSYATTFLRELLKTDEPPPCYYWRVAENVEELRQRVHDGVLDARDESRDESVEDPD